MLLVDAVDGTHGGRDNGTPMASKVAVVGSLRQDSEGCSRWARWTGQRTIVLVYLLAASSRFFDSV
jgi:hypothetical protein